ncbi:MAG: preprotein translocase subunit SecA [Candidatus Cloacimonetes bacterium]|nr:preprotein translocase subunit SecA [Candidatus Cloacimonadota bacterium]MCF7814639.1 preprotein translocase subunit SecA [Candidatus Cloacimonadota bacterium]MCF7869106.1 preprotein translocase subunit SecA [Candidatus Cloacimonadota bacterium]MCF7884531.1 preprotein translocase subunit SecA [Candidatus Cloacimonadota bacterium]
MIKFLKDKLFGSRQEREIKKFAPVVEDINSVYESLESKSDDELRNRITEIRQEIRNELTPREKELEEAYQRYQTEANDNRKISIGNEIDKLEKDLKELNQSLLDDNMTEVFAIVKDTCRRLLGHEYEVRDNIAKWEMVPFDVQLIGAIVLHKGIIAEMATGEGKTLVATMPLFLNALLGHGAHLITVNDYLAQRDSEWMSPIFEFHGLEVGVITTGMDNSDRKEAYEKDITYGTNSEFGFDYLRDNMAVNARQLVQRKHQYAIVDEVDSVLIDEARTPLIISGPVQESKNFFSELKPVIQKLSHAQNTLVMRYLREVKQELAKEEYDADEVGRRLLLIQRAAPKNKSFMKMMKEPELKKLVTDFEGYYLRDKKMHEIDAELFYTVEEKQNSVELSEKGNEFIADKEPDLFVMEQLDDLIEAVDNDESLSYEQKIKKKDEETNRFMDKSEKLHNIKQLLRAYNLFEKEKDYVVVENKVMIVDQFTGRMMPGRRFSDGLHQALEAKENATIEDATQTFATITLQNYFRMYEKLAGMTGTAVTEEGEFQEIYDLSVLEIPTNLPITRIDHDDKIYLTKNEKYKAIIDEIEYWHKHQKPVLVGTVTVEVSETLSRLLRRRNIHHNVLNAKLHEKEAEIVKFAGAPGSVTIATNMAGRGTDIKLGSGVVSKKKEEYLDLDKKVSEEFPYGLPQDGLHVIGTERHESRRIDRQLRGRSGRQGDPGTSRFYLSLEDDLMRLFGSERIGPMMMKFGLQEGEAITHPWMTKTVETAQKRVENYNFESRKQLLKYDEVMNQQREVIYKYRRNVLKGYDLKNEIIEMIKDSVYEMILEVIGEERYSENWQLDEIVKWLARNFNISIDVEDIYSDHLTFEMLQEMVEDLVIKSYEEREQQLTSEQMREIERRVLLSVVDELWRDHLREMDLLKEGIGFRAYAQKDPLIEYKKEAFILFETLVANINRQVSRKVFTTYIVSPENIEDFLRMAKQRHEASSAFDQPQPQAPRPMPNKGEPPKLKPRKVEQKVGRNDPCTCGSGKKYKKCCGKIV